jgi:glutaredoxin
MTRTVPVLARVAVLALALSLFAAAPALAGAPTVELYVTSWCPYCKKAAQYFKSKGIKVKEMNIEMDPLAALRYKRYNARGVPLAVINGTPVAGYSVQAYEKALGGK